MSKVEEFKKVLQKDVSEVLNTKVSQENAWLLYKAFYESTFNHTLDSEKMSFAINGIATFKIATLASGNKKYKIYPSEAYQRKVKEILD